jgi:hypothetical protein
MDTVASSTEKLGFLKLQSEGVMKMGYFRALRWSSRRPGGLLVMVFLALVLAACGKTTATATPSPPVTPSGVIAAPPGLLSGTTPAPNGVMWVLAGTGNVRTLQQIDLASGSDLGAIPAPSSAVAIAQSTTGLLGVGLGTATMSALEIRNSTTGALVATVPVGAPVRSIAAGVNGVTFYVLDGDAAAASVSVINTSTDQVQGTVPVPLHSVAAIPDPEQLVLWVLQPDGLVDEVALSSGKLRAEFSIGNSGLALALSPDGKTLYALKGTSSVCNVAIVHLATESVSRVLPAPADALGLVLSPDGSTLYDLVGTPTVGNIQAFSLGS